MQSARPVWNLHSSLFFRQLAFISFSIQPPQSRAYSSLTKMPSSDLKSEPLKSLTSPPTMAYSNCQTRIIDLQSLNLPSARDTPDSTFCQIYNEYITANKSPDSPHYDNARQLSSAVLSLQTGIAPPVAFPTETVYGLGADATNSASIAGIFAAKGRPSDNPLIVHVSSIDHLERCLGGTPSQSAIPQIYHDLIREFWPGPLTILIPVPQKRSGCKLRNERPSRSRHNRLPHPQLPLRTLSPRRN